MSALLWDLSDLDSCSTCKVSFIPEEFLLFATSISPSPLGPLQGNLCFPFESEPDCVLQIHCAGILGMQVTRELPRCTLPKEYRSGRLALSRHASRLQVLVLARNRVVGRGQTRSFALFVWAKGFASALATVTKGLSVPPRLFWRMWQWSHDCCHGAPGLWTLDVLF